jgi:carbon-monoxide dehydrogenase medium subunit
MLAGSTDARFTYRRARSMEEAITLLQQNEGAKVLAGGQSLMPMVNMRLVFPTMLVDIGHLRDLDYVRVTGGVLEIGALTRHFTLEQSPLVRQQWRLLSAAAGYIGHVQIRNRGTIGGSLSHADPSAELPLIALALGATIRTRGPAGARDIAAHSFFKGIFTTALQPGELVEQVRFPTQPASKRWGYLEQVFRHGDFPIVAVAVTFELENGKMKNPVVALGGVAGTPVLAKRAEESLAGRAPGDEVFRRAAELAASDLELSDNIQASAAYRREMVAVYTRRALESAAK